MQIFLPYSNPYKTAIILDKKRLNKQIIECKQIIKAICGVSKAWSNHPICSMYKNDIEWLLYYTACLENYSKGNNDLSKLYSCLANEIKPSFITNEYCNNFKKRLYTKDHNAYNFFSNLGESYENWYYVNGNWKIYKQK